MVLRGSSRRLLMLGLATAGVSQVLGVILTLASVSTLQICQAPSFSFLVSIHWLASGRVLALCCDRQVVALFGIALALCGLFAFEGVVGGVY